MFFLQLLRAGWSCRTQVRSRSARGRSGTARGTARAAAAVRVRASRGGAPALPARARGRAFTACAADDQWGALTAVPHTDLSPYPLRPISEGDEIQANDSPFAARERPDARRTGCRVGSALPHRPCLPGPRAASSVRPRRPCYRATSTALKLWTNRGLADKRSLCQLAEAALWRTGVADAAGKPVSHCARPPDPQQSQPTPRARPAR
jgi:hypothetical protein